MQRDPLGGGNLKLFVFGCLVLLLVGHWHGVAFGGLVVGLVCCLVISLVVGFLVCVAFFCFGLEQFSRLWHLQNHSDDWAVGSSMGELPLAVRPWAAFWLAFSRLPVGKKMFVISKQRRRPLVVDGSATPGSFWKPDMGRRACHAT